MDKEQRNVEQKRKIRREAIWKKIHTTVHKRLVSDRMNSWYFAEPVDPEALNIPTYFDVIKQPMDLGTVGRNLKTRQYTGFEQYASAVRLTFCNAMTFIGPTNNVYKAGACLLRDFDEGLWPRVQEDISAEKALTETEDRKAEEAGKQATSMRAGKVDRGAKSRAESASPKLLDVDVEPQELWQDLQRLKSLYLDQLTKLGGHVSSELTRIEEQELSGPRGYLKECRSFAATARTVLQAPDAYTALVLKECVFPNGLAFFEQRVAGFLLAWEKSAKSTEVLKQKSTAAAASPSSLSSQPSPSTTPSAALMPPPANPLPIPQLPPLPPQVVSLIQGLGSQQLHTHITKLKERLEHEERCQGSKAVGSNEDKLWRMGLLRQQIDFCRQRANELSDGAGDNRSPPAGVRKLAVDRGDVSGVAPPQSGGVPRSERRVLERSNKRKLPFSGPEEEGEVVAFTAGGTGASGGDAAVAPLIERVPPEKKTETSDEEFRAMLGTLLIQAGELQKAAAQSTAAAASPSSLSSQPSPSTPPSAALVPLPAKPLPTPQLQPLPPLPPQVVSHVQGLGAQQLHTHVTKLEERLEHEGRPQGSKAAGTNVDKVRRMSLLRQQIDYCRQRANELAEGADDTPSPTAAVRKLAVDRGDVSGVAPPQSGGVPRSLRGVLERSNKRKLLFSGPEEEGEVVASTAGGTGASGGDAAVAPSIEKFLPETKSWSDEDFRAILGTLLAQADELQKMATQTSSVQKTAPISSAEISERRLETRQPKKDSTPELSSTPLASFSQRAPGLGLAQSKPVAGAGGSDVIAEPRNPQKSSSVRKASAATLPAVAEWCYEGRNKKMSGPYPLDLLMIGLDGGKLKPHLQVYKKKRGGFWPPVRLQDLLDGTVDLEAMEEHKGKGEAEAGGGDPPPHGGRSLALAGVDASGLTGSVRTGLNRVGNGVGNGVEGAAANGVEQTFGRKSAKKRLKEASRVTESLLEGSNVHGGDAERSPGNGAEPGENFFGVSGNRASTAAAAGEDVTEASRTRAQGTGSKLEGSAQEGAVGGADTALSVQATNEAAGGLIEWRVKRKLRARGLSAAGWQIGKALWES
ncbi:hypothetical protein KFL_003570020 [Klebsormidium nitens]|uniref:Bromo domain-containing protein n=1 Tax=Klebsormidium nitens TaxID=105231 RepID=A0A1Y1IAA1_KLENI|nr:hypothetical protein KFL_003570020 [Klebsormidium nitens]|eukprot:GAQ87493.1 hypothetical protein KFL_003570020 [Klebsormidium nitens]